MKDYTQTNFANTSAKNIRLLKVAQTIYTVKRILITSKLHYRSMSN